MEQPTSEPLQIRMPVSVRGLALTFISLVTAIWVLYVGRSLFVPILIGLGVSSVLSPWVDWLERHRIPRALGAALLVLLVVGLLGMIGYRIAGQAAVVAEELPRAAREIRELLVQTTSQRDGTMAQLQEAADELTEPQEPARRGVTPVRIVDPPMRIGQYLVSGSLGFAGAVGQALLVVFLVYFVLAAGDLYKRKLVKLTGPSLSDKKITVQIIDEIGMTISRYLRTLALVCSLVGVATWLAFLALGVPNAALWGVMAGAANTIPYFGPTMVAGSAAIAAYLHFDTVTMGVMVGGTSLLITAIEGFLITPTLMSRTASMNPVAMFIGILCWGWLWGFWGMLLAVPLLMVLKVIADRVEDLAAAGELLGE